MAAAAVTASEAEFTDRLISIGGFTINLGTRRIGKTQLVMGYNTTTLPTPTRVTVLYVKLNDVNVFIVNEGRVYNFIRNQPHINMPHIQRLLRAGNGDDVGSLYVISNAYFGDLHSHVQMLSRHNSIIPFDLSRSLFSQMIDAVSYCHNNRITLRDMKLGNVMYSDETRTRIIIADLTNSTLMPPSVNLVYDQKGSPAYVAPEILYQQPYNPFKADIWSLGVMAYILFCGKFPFRDENPVVLFQKITNGTISIPPEFPIEAREVVLRMLTRNPAIRPSIEQVQSLWAAVASGGAGGAAGSGTVASGGAAGSSSVSSAGYGAAGSSAVGAGTVSTAGSAAVPSGGAILSDDVPTSVVVKSNIVKSSVSSRQSFTKNEDEQCVPEAPLAKKQRRI